MSEENDIDLEYGQEPHARVQFFEANKQGRDFVVGDIHGAFDLVDCALSKVCFDPKVDRLFCVGDLVDRGSESKKAFDFLNRPNVWSVMGNHDYDLANMSVGLARQLSVYNWNGLGWIKNIEDEDLCALQKRLAQLPLAIQVGDIGIVHAEVPAGMTWPELVQALEAQDIEPDIMESVLWGRARIESRDPTGVSSIVRVFSGHTIQWGGGTKMGNMWAIDTGAVFRELGTSEGFLTLIPINCADNELDDLMGISMEDGVFVGKKPSQGPDEKSAVLAIDSELPGA